MRNLLSIKYLWTNFKQITSLSNLYRGRCKYMHESGIRGYMHIYIYIYIKSLTSKHIDKSQRRHMLSVYKWSWGENQHICDWQSYWIASNSRFVWGCCSLIRLNYISRHCHITGWHIKLLLSSMQYVADAEYIYTYTYVEYIAAFIC